MFIKKITIENFRLFETFEIDNIAKPDGVNAGSGLTLFVGENSVGKTSLLDAMTLPVLKYRTESFSLSDVKNIEEKTKISIFSHEDFEFRGVMPRSGPFKAKGFYFDGGVKSRVNRTYFDKIITTDQKFIRADSEVKPEDGKPDLRISVNNPWGGKRFTENDYLYLDKNRIYQIKSGTFNSTRFDRLMEDFDYQYLKSEGKNNTGTQVIPDFPKVDNSLQDIKQVIKNDFVSSAVNKFQEVSGKTPVLSYIDNLNPHSSSFWCIKNADGRQIRLQNIGSGYEEIFTLILSFYLAKQSEKDLIIFIDEPELHLHPKLQEKFVDILLEFSKEAQIILTSHSALLVKQLMSNNLVEVKVLKNDNGKVVISIPEEKVLSYLSANEVNFVAFDLATEEYHNELYEELMSKYATSNLIKQFDIDYFQNVCGEAANKPWKVIHPNEVSIHTFIRNQIHHRVDNGAPEYNELKSSIIKMRSFLDSSSKS